MARKMFLGQGAFVRKYIFMADPNPTPPSLHALNFPTLRNKRSISDLSCSPLPILCQIPGMDLDFLPEKERGRSGRLQTKPESSSRVQPLPVASLPPFTPEAPLPGAQTG